MIKIGIIGGAGYTAGELIRLLVNHTEADLVFVHSESNAGNPLTAVHSGLTGDTDLHFCSEYDLGSIDVLFLCGAHGKSGEFWAANECPEGLKVIDLAQDFRDESCGYVYGLPEMQKGRIEGATKIANPGCFATAIQLSILPLAAAGLLKDEISVTAITGSTGAGVKPSSTTHFSWREGNISAYKVFEHQHLKEIRRNMGIVQGGASSETAESSESASATIVPPISFIPMRGDFTRGIFAAVHTDCPLDEAQLQKLYSDYYADAAFTFVSDKAVDLKQVVNTNKCLVHVEKHEGKAVITTVIDNLLKGASGQAVQNMNLICGLQENMGLRLKASAF